MHNVCKAGKPKKKPLWVLAVVRTGSVVVSLALNAFLVVMFTETFARSNLLQAQAWMTTYPEVARASWLMVFLLSAVLTVVCCSAAIGVFLNNFVFGLLGVAYHYVLELRGEYLHFTDIAVLGEALGIAGNFAQEIRIPLYIIAGLFLMLLIIPAVCIGQKIHMRFAARAALSTLLIAVTLMYGTAYQKMDSGRFTVRVSDNYKYNGILLGFAHTIPKPGESGGRLQKPDGYEKEMIASILAGHEAWETQTQQYPDVVFIMSESLYDISHSGMMTVQPDPLEKLKTLQQEHWGGMFIAQSYGGGTILPEYEVLTGYRSGDLDGYPFLNRYATFSGMESLITRLERHGYATQAIHQGDRGFYDRGYAYEAMGFDSMIFGEDMSAIDRSLTGYPSDAHLYKELIDAYENRDKTKPWFCHAVTYQNHSPYQDVEGADTFHVSGGMSKEGERTVQNYSAGLLYSMEELEALLEYFETQENPILVVMWGDHAPNFSYFGMEMPEDTLQAALLYETPLLIWNNYGLDVGKTIPDLPDVVAGYRIGAFVLRILGIVDDAYFNYLSSSDAPDLFEVFRGLYVQDGEHIFDVEAYLAAEKEMAALHYDRTMGKNYGKDCCR